MHACTIYSQSLYAIYAVILQEVLNDYLSVLICIVGAAHLKYFVIRDPGQPAFPNIKDSM